ncbi:hypothetical protein AB0893_26135 [Micromonospora aurantiaca]|uniref:hypothetical protein n=1 Tax=Micromonospora aurantiaca (nom. illeg.) TaxID=47850 RepID=UPI003455585A
MASVIDADHQLITTGQVITADPGLASAEFERFCHEIGGHMLCPKRANAKSDPPRTVIDRALLQGRQCMKLNIQTSREAFAEATARRPPACSAASVNVSSLWQPRPGTTPRGAPRTMLWKDRSVAFSLARAVGQAGEYASVFTSSDLELRFIRCGLQSFQPPPPRSGSQRYAKTELIASTLGGAVRAAGKDADVAKGLMEFISLVAERCDEDQLIRLREATRSAGFDLRLIGGEARLLPLDGPHAPLGELVSALESDFQRLGMTVARNHYRQAVDCLTDGRHEAANAQLRAMFEEVLAHLAVQQGFSRTSQGAGGRAIRFLIDQGHLPADDGGNYIHGLWKIVQTNGSHPGTSPAGEAHFRTHALTTAARYLIDRFVPLT